VSSREDAIRIAVGRDEVTAGSLRAERLALARRAMTDDGFVVLDDLVPVEVVDALDERMERDVPELERRALVTPRRWAGHLQHQAPPDAQYVFPEIVANPVVVSLCRAVMGADIQLVLYTANTNTPGSVRQDVHNDINQLWSDVDHAPPAHLIVVNVPLIDTSAGNATELWPGSHLDPRTHRGGEAKVSCRDDWLAERRALRPPIQVEQRRGSVLVRDARLWHAGVPNTTERARVMVAMAYAPTWYAADALTLPEAARSAWEQLGVPVCATFTSEPFDPLDPEWSGVRGRQMRRQGHVVDR
jgi:ectoine hydroxylase-related dioxygenase (phytanoyl-CoA dioxygenase family)